MNKLKKIDKNCDVLIVGAGMAGSCLARQLRRELPDLSIIIVEQKKDFDWWIGESTAEVFDDYAIRNLGLGPYLATNHITKHGLRFFFDRKETDLPLAELSEQGRSRYAILNRGVQLDRRKFDSDLCRMNREAGVEVLMDTRVNRGPEGSCDRTGIDIDPEDRHIVETNRGKIRCRYLVDAGGRGSPLVTQLNLLEKKWSSKRMVGSYWARVEGCKIIDELGDEAWRRRVDYTLRWASTNHFMYDGYWIWLIPIDEKIVSIGVTFDHKHCPIKVKNGTAFMDFIRKHRAIDQLFGDAAELLDFHGFKQNIRGVKQYFSEDRWYLTGMAGLFVDPLFSSNAGLISVNNRMIISLLKADLSKDKKRVENRTRHFNIGMKNIFLRQYNSFSNYHSFGSFDAFVNWQSLRYHSILNYDVAMQHADYQPMIDRIDQHDQRCCCAVGVWSESQKLGEAADSLTREFVSYIDSTGHYYDRNKGYFNEKTERPEARLNTLNCDFGPTRAAESRLNWEAFFRYYILRMCEMEKIRFSEQTFLKVFNPDWLEEQTLEEVIDPMRKIPVNVPEENCDICWGFKGPVNKATKDHEKWRYRFLGPHGKHVHYPEDW